MGLLRGNFSAMGSAMEPLGAAMEPLGAAMEPLGAAIGFHRAATVLPWASWAFLTLT